MYPSHELSQQSSLVHSLRVEAGWKKKANYCLDWELSYDSYSLSFFLALSRLLSRWGRERERERESRLLAPTCQCWDSSLPSFLPSLFTWGAASNDNRLRIRHNRAPEEERQQADWVWEYAWMKFELQWIGIVHKLLASFPFWGPEIESRWDLWVGRGTCILCNPSEWESGTECIHLTNPHSQKTNTIKCPNRWLYAAP